MKTSGLIRLVRDPEMKGLPNGTTVLELRGAFRQYKSDTDGFVDVSMFGARAESLVQYLHKGDQCVVHGDLRYREWDKEGTKRHEFSIVANDIELVSAPKPNGATHGTGQAPKPAPAPAGGSSDEEIPF